MNRTAPDKNQMLLDVVKTHANEDLHREFLCRYVGLNTSPKHHHSCFKEMQDKWKEKFRLLSKNLQVTHSVGLMTRVFEYVTSNKRTLAYCRNMLVDSICIFVKFCKHEGVEFLISPDVLYTFFDYDEPMDSNGNYTWSKTQTKISLSLLFEGINQGVEAGGLTSTKCQKDESFCLCQTNRDKFTLV